MWLFCCPGLCESPIGFMPSTPMSFFSKDRQNFSFETIEVRVHYIEGHLNGIELETVL